MQIDRQLFVAEPAAKNAQSHGWKKHGTNTSPANAAECWSCRNQNRRNRGQDIRQRFKVRRCRVARKSILLFVVGSATAGGLTEPVTGTARPILIAVEV